MLAIYVGKKQDTWDEWLRYVTMAYNSSVHSTTGFTPYKLRFGAEMRLPIHVLTGDPNRGPVADPDPEGYKTYVDELQHHLQEVHAVAQEVTKTSMKTQKDQYDARAKIRQFKVGQPVWVYKPYRKKGVCPKFQCKWDKVYIVTGKLDDVLYRVQKGKKGTGQVVHVQRLMPYEGNNRPTWWRANQQQ